MNRLNFFFSFDKLFKEKLIVPFFWLAIIVWGLQFFEEFLAGINLKWVAWGVDKIGNLITVLLALVTFRLLAEIAIAIFRINDNLSPDGGKSELAEIDPVVEARKAAELAAARTREATRNITEKASEATKNLRENAAEMSETVQSKAKAASASVREKASDLKSKAAANKADPKTLEAPKPKTPASKDTPKKRGRPAGSKNKTTAGKKPAVKKPTAKKTVTKKPVAKKPVAKKTAAKTPAAKTTSTGKRGPKPGTKIPRDKDGNLLKKDGTLPVQPER